MEKNTQSQHFERPLGVYKDIYGKDMGVPLPVHEWSLGRSIFVSCFLVALTALVLRLGAEVLLSPYGLHGVVYEEQQSDAEAVKENLWFSTLAHALWQTPRAQAKIEAKHIEVKASKKPVAKAGKTKKAASPIKKKETTPPYQAFLLLRSHIEVVSDPAAQVSVRVAFKNTGKKAWGVRSLVPKDAASGTPPVAQLEDGAVKPGAVEFYDFVLKMPEKKGTFMAAFTLVADGGTVPGGDFSLPVTVTANAPAIDVGPLDAALAALPPEPLIRVGLFKLHEPVALETVGTYRLLDGSGTGILDLPSGTVVSLEYVPVERTYFARINGQVFADRAPHKLQPADLHNHFIVRDYEDRPSWNKSVNYNKFRGEAYVQWSEKNQTVWLVNVLPLETYLKGLIEASDSSPLEYQKALYTAARTYAYYTMTEARKHADRFFDVDAKWDQVYKGYVAEGHRPRIAGSIDVTRGMMVTYEGRVVVTPYFARSDGRTRTWREVWGGIDKPWIVSIEAGYDKGKTMLGHGVGMSARDAAYRADAGATWEDLLKYYYQGVGVGREYE